MAFLDRFKPQPRWRHADPAVRAVAVAEVPDDGDHRSVLLELATEDPDLRVRRAAIARLGFAADLVRVARSEKDEDLKRIVADRLVAVATAPADNDGEAALALEGLDDPRQLSTIAKQSPHDTVRTAALGRVHDVRALGSVARHAADPQTALEAVARIADRGELFNVALKTDHKDAGLSALERVASADPDGSLRQTLETIASRGKNKVVAKQSRAMAQSLDQAEAARRAAQDAWQQRVAKVLARIEACASGPAGAGTAERLAEAEADWRALSTESSYVLDPEIGTRYGALSESARASVARYEEELAAKRAAEEQRMSVLAAATALCTRVEEIRGDMAEQEIAQAQADWDALAGDPADPELIALRARFLAGTDKAGERFRNRQEAERVHARLDEISQEAASLAAQNESSEHAWKVLVKEWDGLYPLADGLDAAVSERYAAAVERVRQRQEERRAAAERTLRQQLQRIEQLIDRAAKRAAAEDLTLREADRLMRDLRSGMDAIPSGITDERERHALAARLRQAQSTLNPRLHDLREMDEWKRFANAAVQEELIAKTEALRVKFGFDQEGAGPKDEDLEKLAREMHDIQERWKTVAEAPRAQAQALWHRYRQAADPMQTRVREFFVHRNEERRQNLERKIVLIERAEAIADSTDWIKTADELKKLQVEWQQIGPVPRQESKATWKRFREACDRFFTRRNADLAERKEVWSANLARKEALCKRAEELAASTEWDKAAAEIRRLQADWKNVGPVRRNKSEAIWQRFRAASDLFFERFKHRDEIDLQSKQAHREELLAELEALASSPDDGAGAPTAVPGGAEGLLERVRSLRSRWNLTTAVVRHGADPLSGRFMAALENVMAAHPAAFAGTELDADANRQKMERLCAKVEALGVENAAAPPANSSQALAEMLREALAANTIGGRAGEESKWRQMGEEVRQAQAAWSRLGPVPGETGRALAERFHRACNRFQDQYRRKLPSKGLARKTVGTR